MGKAVDRRADVWALAVCLWEMLVARRLFKNTDVLGAIRDIGTATIRRPSSIRKALPEVVDAVVLGGLERKLERRWATAKCFGDAIHGAMVHMHALGHATDLGALVSKACAPEMQRQERLVGALFSACGAAEGNAADRSVGPTIIAPSPSGADVISFATGAPVTSQLTSFPPAVSAHALVDEESSASVDLSEFGRTSQWRTGRARTSVRRHLVKALMVIALVAGVALRLGLQKEVPPEEAGAHAETTESVRDPSEVREGPDSPQPAGGGDAPQAEASPEVEAARVQGPSQTVTGSGVEESPPSESPAASEIATPVEEATSTRAPRREVEAPAPGTLNLVTLGGAARVTRRGRVLGVTPGRFILPAGRHRLRLSSLASGQAQSLSVRIRSGRTSRMAVRLR